MQGPCEPGIPWDVLSELAFIPVCLFSLCFAVIKFLALLLAEVSFKTLRRRGGFIESPENY